MTDDSEAESESGEDFDGGFDQQPGPPAARTGSQNIAQRPRINRVSSLFPLAEVLLHAANSDRPASSREHEAIRGVLCELLGTDELPARLEQRIANFDPHRLNLAALADEFAHATDAPVGRKTLVEFTREVCEADGDLDLQEDRFMLALSVALSLDQAEIGHVVWDTPFRGLKRVIKRAEDLVLGFVFLAICAIPMLIIALAIKLTSKGPVLFRQPRHGENGVEFKVLKFRSMSVMETGGEVVQAQKNDPRVTKLGAFLRKSSLDELPQFLNVIAGDMSIVGPRPHAIAHNELYRIKILEYMRRHKVKPGITGWAQVNGYRGETDTIEKMVARVEHDLAYIRSWSLWFDIRIVFLTVFGRKVRQNSY
ncbi:MAG: Capsular polysaccharide synthesis enzyme CpsA, sugar transferase [Myxococcaceae bacterium]|nr:Capsular polysaccharide synthesis enzyme CpsA, sugar transferase [Myxococcaceae bacterium]